MLESWQIATMTEIGTYMQAIQIGTGSSMCSLSVLLSVMETSLRTQTGIEIAQ